MRTLHLTSLLDCVDMPKFEEGEPGDCFLVSDRGPFEEFRVWLIWRHLREDEYPIARELGYDPDQKLVTPILRGDKDEYPYAVRDDEALEPPSIFRVTDIIFAEPKIPVNWTYLGKL